MKKKKELKRKLVSISFTRANKSRKKKPYPDRKIVSLSFNTEHYEKILTVVPKGATVGTWLKYVILNRVEVEESYLKN